MKKCKIRIRNPYIKQKTVINNELAKSNDLMDLLKKRRRSLSELYNILKENLEDNTIKTRAKIHERSPTQLFKKKPPIHRLSRIYQGIPLIHTTITTTTSPVKPRILDQSNLNDIVNILKFYTDIEIVRKKIEESLNKHPAYCLGIQLNDSWEKLLEKVSMSSSKMMETPESFMIRFMLYKIYGDISLITMRTEKAIQIYQYCVGLNINIDAHGENGEKGSVTFINI